VTDLYTQIVNNSVGNLVARNVGLPVPAPLERWSPGAPVLAGRALVGAAPGGRLGGAIASTLAAAGIEAATETQDDLRSGAAAAGLDAAVWNADAPAGDKFKALVFDATGIADSTRLVELHRFFHPAIRALASNGRIVVLGTAPEDAANARVHTAQRALEGFTRSIAKEVRAGGTAQLVYVAPGAERLLESTLRFLLSPKSAYVSGQVARVGSGEAAPADVDWERPLRGKTALVTGASRGIGASIAATLARDGAHVVGLDVPPLADDLRAVTKELGGSAVSLDITTDDAPEAIRAYLDAERGGVDVVVHNAGVTRDKTIAGMDADRWRQVLDINLSSEERINDALVEAGLIGSGGRIVCVSSMSGIAGNNGQTNYATSKAGVIGMVQSLAPALAERGATINAVAPGFIETQMTQAMPVPVREAGRRMSSLRQGGLPVDVAEAIAWFANPASGGLNGNAVRVCGQNLLGA
jgi:3-oxoacyl-[acyl-carrier protein] reductase